MCYPCPKWPCYAPSGSKDTKSHEMAFAPAQSSAGQTLGTYGE